MMRHSSVAVADAHHDGSHVTGSPLPSVHSLNAPRPLPVLTDADEPRQGELLPKALPDKT